MRIKFCDLAFTKFTKCKKSLSLILQKFVIFDRQYFSSTQLAKFNFHKIYIFKCYVKLECFLESEIFCITPHTRLTHTHASLIPMHLTLSLSLSCTTLLTQSAMTYSSQSSYPQQCLVIENLKLLPMDSLQNPLFHQHRDRKYVYTISVPYDLPANKK